MPKTIRKYIQTLDPNGAAEGVIYETNIGDVRNPVLLGALTSGKVRDVVVCTAP